MVNVISFNVNGLLSPGKRNKILLKLKKENIDIAFLQETHMTEIDHQKLKRYGFKHVFSSSNGFKHNRGVAILISGRVTYEHLSIIKDREGRFILIKGKVNGNYFTLYNVYIPPGSNSDFHQKIIDRAVIESQGILLCGGDFNITLNPSLDSSNTRTSQPKKLTKKITSIISEVGLVDVWRFYNPSIRDYTHFSSPHSSYSRIDYFLLFGRDVCRVQSCRIGSIDLSDHCPVYLTLTDDRRIKPGYWRLNSSILNKDRIEQFSKDITDYLTDNDNDEVSPPTLWDACKAVMRGKVIATTSFLKKQRIKRLSDLQLDLKKVELEHKQSFTPGSDVEMKKLRNQINEILGQEIQKKLIYTKQKYYEGGGKYSKLLAYKLKKQEADNTIYKIRDSATKNILQETEEIKNCFKDYYEKLYSQPQVHDDDKLESMLRTLDLPTVSDDQNSALKLPISEGELASAITRLKTSKSPGADGFTSEWYKGLREALTPILLKTFNWVFKKGEIPNSWREATISVIPKGGKDKLNCSNYRPISVLNIDYKIFASIIAKRLEKVLPTIINIDQTGFVMTRQTHDNIRRSLQIIRHINQNKIEAMLISIDAQKAFDSVRWKFLFKVMEKFGFNKQLIESLEALYTKPEARLKINGELSDSFQLERSTRQGCPLSPLLFAIFIEPLAQCIRQNNLITGVTLEAGEQKLALFADDILIYLTNPTDSLPNLMSILEEYGSYSGYSVNKQKTQVLNFHYDPPHYLRSRYQLDWDKKCIKYLGIFLPLDLSTLQEINYGPLKKVIMDDINRWSLIPYLSIYSRIDSIKMNILPRLLYIFQTIPIEKPEHYFMEWDKLLARFIWAGKKPRVRFKTLKLSKDRGGLALPCLLDYYKAAQLRFLVGWCTPSYRSRWKEIECTMGGRYPMSMLIGDCSLIDQITDPDNPWISCSLRIWDNITKRHHLRDKMGILKWFAYDSDFIPSIYDKQFLVWNSKGLSTYSSLLKQDLVLSFQELKDRFGLENQDHFRYLQIRDFIQKSFIRKEKVPGKDIIIDIFLKASEDVACKKTISRLYVALQALTGDNTMSIKSRWEKDSGLSLSQEEWEGICAHQWRMTSSPSWRFFGWKNIMRFFCTPAQKAKYSTLTNCWRGCGCTVADHFHIFWNCTAVASFWSSVHNHLELAFRLRINFDFKTLYLCDFEELQCGKYLMRVLLVAAKKALTRKWLQKAPPTVDDWIDVVYDIYNMERITFTLRNQYDKFYENWLIWVYYVSAIRPDFV
ncbi:LINE-1 retrotransposable element ORF2 protein isoform X1 [Sardina pilchardus]|uniref:LINE-1 retrotransposable element ORF2 protein isoform X1 n=1 Tax=Sardina pilchardus TaxID=27697 RepID=UPI002E1161E7